MTKEEAISNLYVQYTLTSLEACIVRLLELNKKLDKNSQADMPYS
jgi:hypothetical protein